MFLAGASEAAGDGIEESSCGGRWLRAKEYRKVIVEVFREIEAVQAAELIAP